VRANVKNIVQIYHEKVATSYTKQAAVGQFATAGSAPFISYDGLGTGNPVTNEHTWQIAQALKQIARDANFAFWHAQKNVPVDTSTDRQTAGLLSVIATNKTWALAEVSATAATDTVTKATHGMSDGDQVVFTDVGVATAIRVDRKYYLVSSAAGTFKVAATAGGSAITIGTATVKYVQVSGTASVGVSVDKVNALVQGIFDNGGMTEGETRTLFVPSIQKTRITKAYATAYGSNVNGALGMSSGHTVGGVAVDRIVTDFGELNLVVDRALPPDCVVAASTRSPRCSWRFPARACSSRKSWPRPDRPTTRRSTANSVSSTVPSGRTASCGAWPSPSAWRFNSPARTRMSTTSRRTGGR
jgi:Family of unknown function (DUF5309)